jgi:hypothetical protein
MRIHGCNRNHEYETQKPCGSIGAALKMASDCIQGQLDAGIIGPLFAIMARYYSPFFSPPFER